MRKERLIYGLNNKQVIRFVVDGFMMHTTVQGIQNIASRKHRVAVWSTTEKLSLDRELALRTCKPVPTGLAWTVDVRNDQDQLEQIQVQVDLCGKEAFVW